MKKMMKESESYQAISEIQSRLNKANNMIDTI